MITIVGSREVSEYRAALQLRSLISAGWPDVVESERDHITIVVAAKCFGCSIQDIDLVVIGNLAKPRALPQIAGVKDQSLILSFVWTIEVKSHSAEAVQFAGGKVFVPYGQLRKDATEQAFKQQNSLRDYLKRNIRRDPFCSNLLWMENCRTEDIPRIEHINVVAGDSTWDDFLRAAAGTRREWLQKPNNRLLQAFHLDVRAQYAATREVCDLFAKPQRASRLDRQRVERISRKLIDDQAYAEKLGSQLLLFRGRGGTGKTMTLIRLALDLHTSRLSRVLLLTYNVALVSDIKRTLAIIGAPRDADGPVIQVRTVHSFILELMKQAGIVDDVDRAALEAYDSNLSALLSVIEAFSDDDLPSFDFVFIDEAQDWPEHERDIIVRIFGAKRTVVADGIDQLVRSTSSTDWTARIGNTPKQVVPLRRSLRLKHTLARFSNVLAEELNLLDWNLQENPELSGGRVTVILGPLGRASEMLKAEIAGFVADDNSPVDSLICVPYTTASSGASKRVVDLATQCGYSLWDGTSEEGRRSFATDPGQARIVTYESCRGLEGWSVVCCQLDKLYDQKKKDAVVPSDLLTTAEETSHRHAASWLMIPVTRAIDHLVLHVEDPAHPIARALERAASIVGAEAGATVVIASGATSLEAVQLAD